MDTRQRAEQLFSSLVRDLAASGNSNIPISRPDEFFINNKPDSNGTSVGLVVMEGFGTPKISVWVASGFTIIEDIPGEEFLPDNQLSVIGQWAAFSTR